MAAIVNPKKSALNKMGLFYLLIVYIVWGSTYLAIRVGLREGAGFTPFVFGSMRALCAGAILLFIGTITKQRIKLTRKELLILAGSGILLWTGGNGFVMLGETHADSSMAALIVSGTPIFVMLIDSFIDRKKPSLITIVSLLTGTAGIVVLSMPVIMSGIKADILSVFMFVLASLSWSAGTVVQSRNPLNLSPAVASGYQCFFGGMGFVVIAFALREPIPTPIGEAWIAWAYLVVFGSVIAFTAFLQALQLLPTPIVMTYSYVNPIIAVILGWIILAEKITPWTIAGAILVLLAVNGVFRERKKHQQIVEHK
jgi:drug/metabolite transporter (DMT)-like permease